MRLGVERVIDMFACLAVETYQVSRLAEDGSELVHDAALYAHVVVFGGLPYQGEGHFVEAEREHVVERKCVGALECGRRAHARTERYIAGEYGIEPRRLASSLCYLAAYTEDIFGPQWLWGIALFEAEFTAFVEVEGRGADTIGAVEAYCSRDAFVYRSGQNESAVVVGMFAYEVDTAGRGVDFSPGAVISLEFLRYEVDIHVVTR